MKLTLIEVIALRALRRNAVRTTLTMLGVAIGVAAVIAVISIGSGATRAVQAQISAMGQSMLVVMPGASSSGAMTFGIGSVQTLTPEDATSIVRECPSASRSSVMVRARAQIVHEDLNWSPLAVLGCDVDYLAVRQWPTSEGDGFTAQDVRSAAQVCLLGQTVADNLFENGSPLGERVRIQGLPFRVVGVLARKGANLFGADQDDVVIVPWTTCKKKIVGSAFDNVDGILVTLRAGAEMSELREEVQQLLRANHHIPTDAAGVPQDDFTIRDMTELRGAMTAATSIMTRLLALIASVSLVVGGIGIMNIMLVSVTERTHEIGLRMAVGATPRDVLAQFLVEALVLTAMGGALGLTLGALSATVISRATHWPVIVSGPAIVVAVAFTVGVGVLFGFYPAWRASRFEPVEALRYE